MVTLTANPSQYWTFDHWSGAASGSQNPLTFTINGSQTVDAVFVQTSFPLIVYSPGGGSFTENGQSVAVQTYSQTYYPSGTLVSLSANPNNGWSFIGWGGISATSTNQMSLTMNQPQSVTGIFGTTVTATNTMGGGKIVLSVPNPIPCGYAVTLSAVPDPGNYFSNWTGAISNAFSPQSFTVTTANPMVTAKFAPLPAGKISVTTVVVGDGNVTVWPQQSYLLCTNGIGHFNRQRSARPDYVPQLVWLGVGHQLCVGGAVDQ